MSLSYFNVKKLRRQSKQHDSHDSHESAKPPPGPTVSMLDDEPAASPVLDEEDEKFLERLAAIAQEPEGTPPPLPTRPAEVVENGEKKVGRDAQDAIMYGADKVPLPTSPPEVTVEDTDKEKDKTKDGGLGRRKSVMSYFALAQSKFKRSTDKETEQDKKEKEKDHKEKKKNKVTYKGKQKAANDLHYAAEAAKSAKQEEAEKEQQDISEILDQLNLSAVNNRVFSFSKESEELLNKFKLVLKDTVNGAPTAYNDLEKLFTDYDTQLKKMYGNLPPFLQSLVKSLPAKLTATLGPELMAAQAEKPGFDAKQRAAASSSKRKSKKAGIPSLKSLMSAEGAVATMLRSILNFLKLRFPAVMTGTNVIMSLAVFLLLFVLWYCHRRGRETRLEKERLAAEEADSAMASSASSFTEDGDSVFGDNSNGKQKEKPQPQLIISDGKEGEPKTSSARVEDMPSVSHLPDPATPAADTLAKEEPLKVPKGN